MFQRHEIQNNETMLITTNIKNRKSIFSNDPFALEAVETLYRIKLLYLFELYGFVIMPDHCHLLLRVLAPAKISTIMKQWKSGVSFNIGLGPIWQSRFHIRTPDDVYAALRYIHMNPVKAGLVTEPHLYPWSSANERWEVDQLYI